LKDKQHNGQNKKGFGLGLWCLTPPSTIFKNKRTQEQIYNKLHRKLNIEQQGPS
jgi:hypothetical protein